MVEFDYRVAGIPCIIRILAWEPYVPEYLGGPPEKCYEAEGGYGDFEVLDSKGKKAPWLEKKVTPEIRADIERQMFEIMEE